MQAVHIPNDIYLYAAINHPMFFLNSYLACLTMSPKMVFWVVLTLSLGKTSRDFSFSCIWLYARLHRKLCDAAACFILVAHFSLAQQLVRTIFKQPFRSPLTAVYWRWKSTAWRLLSPSGNRRLGLSLVVDSMFSNTRMYLLDKQVGYTLTSSTTCFLQLCIIRHNR